MPNDPIKDFAVRIDHIIHTYFPGGMTVKINGVDEAKLYVTQCDHAKKELAMLKKEVGVAKKAEKADYATERARLQSSSARSGLFGKKVGGIIKHSNTRQRAGLRQNEQAEMGRYDHLISLIDQRVVALDRAKLQMHQFMATLK
jgi:hypothetical protein